jgi:hypothetical protein
MEDRTSSQRKKRPASADAVTVTFADVAGVDSAKQELAEVVAVMKVRTCTVLCEPNLQNLPDTLCPAPLLRTRAANAGGG